MAWWSPCWITGYPKKYAHGCVVLCLVVVMQSFIMNSREVFIHTHQGCFAGTGTIIRLPQCQWSKPDGYGSCVYLVVKMRDRSFVSSLVMSKCRVASIKVVTVPPLELLGARMSARLLDYVRKALKLPADVSYYCWNESRVVLSWIRCEDSRWKAFVRSHKASEIQGLTCPDRWWHCPGMLTPPIWWPGVCMLMNWCSRCCGCKVRNSCVMLVLLDWICLTTTHVLQDILAVLHK